MPRVIQHVPGVPALSMTRRRMVGQATAVIGSAAAGACVPGQPADSIPAASQTPVTLRYAAPFGPSIAVTVEAGRTRIVEAFNARGSHQVRLETPQNLYVSVLAQAAAGDPPDLSHTLPREYHPFVNAGALLELDPFMKRDRKNVSDILQSVLDNWVRDGHNWALPQTYPVQALYFNRALFDKHGLKHPDQYEKEGKWSVDTYLDLARKLTTGAGETKVWGGFWPNSTLDIQAGFLWSFGGHMWDRDMKRRSSTARSRWRPFSSKPTSPPGTASRRQPTSASCCRAPTAPRSPPSARRWRSS
ncbi:MAG: extracellular solute-binding protein [Chloroflexi bacterium]|nr:extracellular solute-binding protein [Chloroflexota bacterium]